jgi:hypothetical protein
MSDDDADETSTTDGWLALGAAAAAMVAPLLFALAASAC